MGSAASLVDSSDDEKPTIIEVNIKKLPEAIEESIYMHEKFPLIIDPTEQAGRFLKYQTGSFILHDDPIQNTGINLNKALVGAMRHGRTLTLKFATLEGLDDSQFTEGLFPKEIISRPKFFQDEVWQSVVKPENGDPDADDMTISSEFVFIIVTTADFVPPALMKEMCVIRVVDKTSAQQQQQQEEGGGSGDPAMEQIASLYGATEIIRNSTALVEAAFDGNLGEVQLNIDKGYHLESVDGRKHTALSEAACQGHLDVMNYLLQSGADPNAVNDMGRTPMWRASFNGHLEAVRTLLEAGGNPDSRDKTSMESVFDVAATDEVRALLSEWDIARTVELIKARRRIMLANLESRIRTSVEREQHARNLIRKELVEKAVAGDVAGIRETLELINQEVEKGSGITRPRATVEVRNDSGQSLLSIAAQYEHVELATFLLTHWKTVDEGKWDLAEGEISPEAKIFRANPNSRDLKGWTCLCIAVFHDSRKVLQLLLEHGGDPNIRSSYNKNAWDLAKDETDAAEHVVKSKAEIRQVLIDFDRGTKDMAKKSIFGDGGNRALVVNGERSEGDLYEGLDKDGTAMVMQLEMNKEKMNSSSNSNNKSESTSCPKPKVKSSSGDNGGKTGASSGAGKTTDKKGQVSKARKGK